MKTRLIVAVHGILTGRSSPTWPERFELWCARALRKDVTVVTDHYKAGPFPLLNCWLKNPFASMSLDLLVENYLDGLDPEDVELHFVAHSNGCDIVRRSAIHLLKRGYQIDSLLLFSAPCQVTTQRLGLAPYLANGALGRLVIYAADADEVLAPSFSWRNPLTWLRRAIRWPYGNVGRVGLMDADQVIQRGGDEVTGRAVTRIFGGWGHGDFFPLENPGRMAGVFELIARDMGLTKPRKRNESAA